MAVSCGPRSRRLGPQTGLIPFHFCLNVRRGDSKHVPRHCGGNQKQAATRQDARTTSGLPLDIRCGLSDTGCCRRHNLTREQYLLHFCESVGNHLDLRDMRTCHAHGRSSRLAFSKVSDAPDNPLLMPLPLKLPELNRVENVGQFIRPNWLLTRFFNSYRDIVNHCCFAWNKLTD